jgi:hypothetical protein
MQPELVGHVQMAAVTSNKVIAWMTSEDGECRNCMLCRGGIRK